MGGGGGRWTAMPRSRLESRPQPSTASLSRCPGLVEHNGPLESTSHTAAEEWQEPKRLAASVATVENGQETGELTAGDGGNSQGSGRKGPLQGICWLDQLRATGPKLDY